MHSFFKNTTLWFYLTQVIMAAIKETATHWWGCKGPFSMIDRSANWSNCHRNEYGDPSKKITTRITLVSRCDPLGIHTPKGMKGGLLWGFLHTWVYEDPISNSKGMKWATCPSADGRLKNCGMYKLEWYPIRKNNVVYKKIGGARDHDAKQINQYPINMYFLRSLNFIKHEGHNGSRGDQERTCGWVDRAG